MPYEPVDRPTTFDDEVLVRMEGQHSPHEISRVRDRPTLRKQTPSIDSSDHRANVRIAECCPLLSGGFNRRVGTPALVGGALDVIEPCLDLCVKRDARIQGLERIFRRAQLADSLRRHCSLVAVASHLDCEVGLGSEVEVEGLAGDPSRVRDLTHRKCVESASRKQAQRRFQNPYPSVCTLT